MTDSSNIPVTPVKSLFGMEPHYDGHSSKSTHRDFRSMRWLTKLAFYSFHPLLPLLAFVVIDKQVKGHLFKFGALNRAQKMRVK